MTDTSDHPGHPVALTRTCRDPFRGATAVAAGETTRDRLRGPDFLRVGPNLYLGAATVTDVRTRLLTLHTWARGRGVVAGPLAALAYGADCPWDDAELVVPGHRRLVAIPDVRVRCDRLPEDEIAERHGVPLTTPLRTAFDLARRAPLREPVAAVDAVARRCGFDADDVRPVADRHPGVRGVVQARAVLDLVDRRARSPMESRMRLLCTRPDLPSPVPQHRVYLPAGRWRDLDLAWPRVPAGRRLLGLEYDGDEHRTITGQNRDDIRDGELDDLGWETIRVTSAMIYDERLAARLLERVRRRVTALRRP